MPTHLVTGGAGFIGSHLVDLLIAQGDDVVVLDNLDGGAAENVHPEATLIVGSVTDRDTVAGLFSSYHFEKVFHLAAFAAEGISHAVKHHNYTVNLLGSVNLINAALGADTTFFAFASSVAVYGHGHVPMREDDHAVPADSYGNAKLAVERELAVTMRMQNLAYTALRMHNVYGERQNMADPYRNAVAIFLNQIMRGEPISIYGDGGQRRAFTYVRDIASAFHAAASCPRAWGQSLNLGAREDVSILEMAHAVRCAMGVPDHPIVHLPGRDEVRAAYTDSSRARELLGDWIDSPLTDALATTAAWATACGPVTPRSSLHLEVSQTDEPGWLSWAAARTETH